ncbi:hypothetical protein C2S52_020575 [Perilla frutescens var. hirtella]|nr:hypothetical protein C2S52_020575 [Perilla frutescens var. hirtella]
MIGVSTPVLEFMEVLHSDNLSLGYLRALHAQLANGDLGPEYEEGNIILYYQNRYDISFTSTLLPRLLEEVHVAPLSGYVGIKRTLALYGRLPHIIPGYTSGETKVQVLDEILVERGQLLRTLKDNLVQAQHRMHQNANRQCREVEFLVGELVSFYGPFLIEERVGTVAYCLKLPTGSRIHSVFHVSALKPFKGDETLMTQALPAEAIGVQPFYKPIAICAKCEVPQKGRLRQQVLVQWDGLAPKNSTWENLQEFSQAHLDIHLVDKVISDGKVNVMQHKSVGPSDAEVITPSPIEPTNI